MVKIDINNNYCWVDSSVGLGYMYIRYEYIRSSSLHFLASCPRCHVKLLYFVLFTKARGDATSSHCSAKIKALDFWIGSFVAGTKNPKEG